MSETLSLSGLEYIPAKVAGKRFGYTGDYIAKLARDGVVVGSKVGNQWFVVEASVNDFVEHKTREKSERNEAIRVMRQQELADFQKRIEPKTKEIDFISGRRIAVLETLVILIIGLSVGASGYVLTTQNTQTASIPSASYSAIERLAVSFYSFITGGRETETTVVQVKSVPEEMNGLVPLEIDSPHGTVVSSTGTTTHTSLVIAPGEVFTATTVEAIRDSLSDDVSVSLDPLNPDTGIIIPHFRDRDGEAYRFLLAPISTNQSGG